MERIYCVDCGAETELDCICDDLNYRDENYAYVNGERVSSARSG